MNRTVFTVAAVLGAIAAYLTIREKWPGAGGVFAWGPSAPGEPPAANPINRAADAIARGVTGNPGSIGTMAYDSAQQSGNALSRQLDAWARSLSPSATPDATVGTLLYDWLNPPPKPQAPQLSRALAMIDST